MTRDSRSISIRRSVHERLAARAAVDGVPVTDLVARALDGFDGRRVHRRGEAPPSPLGEAVRALRRAKGWTQDELGERAGLTGRTRAVRISQWEHGRARPQRRVIAALIALGLDLPARAMPEPTLSPAEIARRVEEGAAIRAWRHATGRTLARAAVEIGVPMSTLSYIEHGVMRLPPGARVRLEERGFGAAERSAA